jgi:ATP-dependent exoDNAse (exonuclease V) alpha subunit
MQRMQFPVRPAFAMTINKSQGQTFEFVGVDLTSEVFAHGQLYVAFSRTRRFSSLKVLLHRDKDQPTTKNIVYKEIL